MKRTPSIILIFILIFITCSREEKRIPDTIRSLTKLGVAKTEPKVKEWFTGRIYLNEVLEEAVRLQRTPQEALNNAAQRLLIEIQ